jgi:hypothetical protein
MKFEDIETTWGLQQPAKPDPINVEVLRRSLGRQLGRRKRVLVLIGIGAVIGLVAVQALFFINLRAAQTETTWVAFGRLMLHQLISLAFVFELVRVYLRHRRLAQGRAGSVREVVGLSLAGVEGEMADYRMGRWMLLVMMGHSFFTIWLNQPLYGTGLDGFGVRVGIIVAVYGLIGLLCWRHYRRVLQPRHDELKATVQQLDEAET